MQLEKIVIHEIEKKPKETGATLNLSKNCLKVSSKSENLAERLLNSFNEEGPQYAIFDEESGSTFQSSYNNYLDSLKDDACFLSFTVEVTTALKEQISSVILAKGGFLVFIWYKYNSIDYLSVFLIRDNKGIIFEKNSQSQVFDINEIEYMNIDKLAMACRINLYGFKNFINSNQKYIALIKKRQSDISDYFYNWINIKQPESSKDYTKKLYDIISKLPLPLNTETGQHYSIEDVRQLVVDNINSAHKIVKLDILGEQIYNDKSIIIKYVHENEIIIDNEFRADSKTLTKFFKVSVKADGISVTFARGDFNEKIRTGTDNPNITIIESGKFAEALRKQLESI